MPPHFKSAQQKRPASPSDHDSNQEQNEQNKKRNASYLENLYPEKFGGQKQHQNNRNHNNNNNNGKNRLPPAAAPSWCHIPGTKDENGTPVIIPRVGVPVPLPPRSGPTRRERSASAGNNKKQNQQQSSSPNGVRHITFDRQVIRKINPSITIPEREKPNFWFQEGMEESVESEYVTMNIGTVNMLELPGPSNLLLVGWENEETGAETGRVTLYMSQLPPGMQRPDPTKMVAVCTLNPFQNAIPMKIVLPAGPYMFEARYCNKKLMPKQHSSDSEGAPKVLLLLETRGESFCLK